MRELTGLVVFILGAVIGWALHENKAVHECAIGANWRQSPHEKQPEPMLVKRGVSLERWVL